MIHDRAEALVRRSLATSCSKLRALFQFHDNSAARDGDLELDDLREPSATEA
jgi:hypothetical protein